ncbi:predicted protein [Histoplasma mississippiense (nom. inval.)]|uniref:predicted protein n=1 Tax=Ajellomyces capsulatus (strain NAm1 / WU24) TaxID=2059318 RepID=UPI000157CCB8|nr:predicted protein [Histoplasma mississippiense (nom. inval.)]EDN10579.1 predicted protein [Histoplasma mississippiense (nom. inval.)]
MTSQSEIFKSIVPHNLSSSRRHSDPHHVSGDKSVQLRPHEKGASSTPDPPGPTGEIIHSRGQASFVAPILSNQLEHNFFGAIGV